MGGTAAGLIVDFVRASRLAAAGDTSAALRVVLSQERAGGDLDRRVREVLTVGALLTGSMTSGYRVGGVQPVSMDGEVRLLAAHLLRAGARLDCGGIEELIVAHQGAGATGELLVSALVELLVRFAAGTGS